MTDLVLVGIKVKCPKCGYRYELRVPEGIEWEVCPMCGCFAHISEFKVIYNSKK